MAGGKLENGIIEFAGANTSGWTSNLGITLSGGTLTITDAQGAALSTSNPGWVTLPSTTAGQLITLQVTANASFKDDTHASSDLTNLGFGVTETANWANDVPFFLYAANRANSTINGVDGNSVFFLSRRPNFTTMNGTANNIGDTGAIPVNDGQDVVLILGDVTVANYTGLNCVLIGCLRMRWASATTDWTVQALNRFDGIGPDFLDATFQQFWTYPTGQNGAAAGTFIQANGGTAPIFTTSTYIYKLTREAEVLCRFYLEGDGGTDGAGAVDVHFTIPYANTTALTQSIVGSALIVYAAGTIFTPGSFILASSNAYCTIIYQAASTVVLDNADFPNGSRSIQGWITFTL